MDIPKTTSKVVFLKMAWVKCCSCGTITTLNGYHLSLAWQTEGPPSHSGRNTPEMTTPKRKKTGLAWVPLFRPLCGSGKAVARGCSYCSRSPKGALPLWAGVSFLPRCGGGVKGLAGSRCLWQVKRNCRAGRNTERGEALQASQATMFLTGQMQTSLRSGLAP